jgi:hypothetical protein
MEGNLVHTVPISTYLPRFLENGNILAFRVTPNVEGKFTEMDWDGNVVWEIDPISGYTIHHDWLRIFNTKINEYTTLAVAYKAVSSEDCIAAGADPECEIENGATPDTVIEIDMDGNIIWEWRFWDHIIQNYDPAKLNYGDPTAEENWGKLDINLDTNSKTGLSLDWNHVNSMDYNEHLDQIVINSREHGEIYFIDHSLTTEEAAGPAGDFVYRWGNPANYGQGDPPTFNSAGHEQLFGAHCIHWIDDELPGAGNLLIFENASFRPRFVALSHIYEINPYDGPMENGVYIQQHDAGYTEVVFNNSAQLGRLWENVSNQVVWTYNEWISSGYYQWAGKGMYSPHISGCQRLPNGNTLMCAGEEGHFVEVTHGDEANGVLPEVVWEYVNPVTFSGKVVTRVGSTQAMDNQVYRCFRFSPDYPGFAGKDLTPKGKLTEMAPVENIEYKLQNFLAQ